MLGRRRDPSSGESSIQSGQSVAAGMLAGRMPKERCKAGFTSPPSGPDQRMIPCDENRAREHGVDVRVTDQGDNVVDPAPTSAQRSRARRGKRASPRRQWLLPGSGPGRRTPRSSGPERGLSRSPPAHPTHPAHPTRRARARGDRRRYRLPTVGRENYEILGEVAVGGIGRIRRAREDRLGRPVALKELRSQADARVEARFVREALITARLQHPSIIPIYEAGRWPSGELFYAMKLVAGRSLAEALEGRSYEQRLELLPTCSTWPRPSPTPTAGASSTGISSPPTSSSASSARRWSSTGASPRTSRLRRTRRARSRRPRGARRSTRTRSLPGKKSSSP